MGPPEAGRPTFRSRRETTVQPTRLRHRAWAMATPLALLLALPAAGAAAPTPGGAGSTSETATAAAGGTQVTLVTGDRVRLTAQPGGRMAATVEPAARDGHEPVFQTVGDDEHTYLFPSDVVPLLDT